MTSAIKWEPVEDLKAVHKLLKQSILGRFGSKLVEGRPLMDLYETDEAYVAEIDAPGVNLDDLDLSVQGSDLTIILERSKDASLNYLYQERPVGSLARTISVPASVDLEGIQAKMGEGVLVLTMPKRPEAQQTKIEVTGS